MASIRLATPEDVPVLVRYWHEMLVECGLVGSGLVPDWEARLQETFLRDMQAGSGTWFVAQDGQAIDGACAVFLHLGRSNVMIDKTAMLAGMYVLPERRGNGIAHRLTERAITWCREAGCTALRLQASRQGRPVYESFGFVTATEMMRLDLD